MAVALAVVQGPIPDSERFIELAETPPLLQPGDLPQSAASTTSSPTDVPSPPPLRPRRSSQRGLQIFTPATHHGIGNVARNSSIIDLYARGREDGDTGSGNAPGAQEDEERFYSPLSTPALVGTIHHSPHSSISSNKTRNRTSEIPVIPSGYNANVNANVNGKEAGVKRAFRSKVGTDGSISLSILPSAAALSEMLELDGGSATSTILSTYQPATTFHRSVTSLHAPEADAGGSRRGSAPDIRRGSAVSTGSMNTRPLTIKRKKPALYHPEDDALPVSRAASIDACTPTSEVPPAAPFAMPTTASTLQNSPPRNKNSDLALPVTQTFQTPLKRIPQSDVTPPSTPPTWTGSTHSDTYTEEESLPISPRSSRDRKAINQSASGVPPVVNPRKLEYGHDQENGNDEDVPPEIPRRATNDHVDLEFLTPMMCDIEDMQDRPGILRGESDDDSSDMEYDYEDDDEDDDSDHAFRLESFPVPSIVLSSAKNTPRMYPVSPNPGSGQFNPDITASPAMRKASIASENSRLRPKTDLYPIPVDADGNQEWDQATELEVRDRVFRAEIKKANKTDKARRKALQKVFDQLKRPTKLELYEASLYSVRDENGHKVRFGSLFEEKKTIVCFIRHFWCSQCQNYVDAVTKVRPEVLAKHNMKLVIISNGSWKMIKSYRKLLGNKCPYPIYTDRAKHIYTTLGMTLRSWDAGKGNEVGNYIQHSLGGSIVAGIKAGAKLPLKPPGDQQQLGGEFILGPGLNVHFTHRMKTTRGHAEIEDVLASAGINLDEENRLFGVREGSETPNGHLDHKSYYNKKDKDRKRSSAIQYSNGNGVGSNSAQGSPSLASSILNRLTNSPRSAPSSPKRFSIGGMSPTPATSPPGSPMASTTHFDSNGNTSPPTSPTRKRLVKKNRASAILSNGFNSNLGTTQHNPISSRHSAGGVSLSQSMNDIRMSRGRFGKRRPSSSSTLPESKTFPSLSAPMANGNENIPEVEDENLAAEEEEQLEEERIRNSLMNKARKHSSAPPVIPTPTTITPLSMGFLQVPSAASRSSSSLDKSLDNNKNKASQATPSFFYSSIPDANLGNGNLNRRMSSGDSIQKVKPLNTEMKRTSVSHPEMKHRYSATNGSSASLASSYNKEKKAAPTFTQDNNSLHPPRNDAVYNDDDGALHSAEIRPTSSRFSESSGDEDNSSSKKDSTKRSSKRTSSTRGGASSSPSLSSAGKSFVRSLTLRSSNSSLKSGSPPPMIRPPIVRLDSKQ